jgi:hypothetical protein
MNVESAESRSFFGPGMTRMSAGRYRSHVTVNQPRTRERTGLRVCVPGEAMCR